MNGFIVAMKKRFYLIMLSVLACSILLALTMSNGFLGQILSLSLFSKELILALIPLIIFSCSYQCMYRLQSYGVVLLVMMLALIASSNFFSSWIGYAISKLAMPYLNMPDLQATSSGLEASWILHVPRLIKNEVALMLGLSLGLSSRMLFKEKFSAKFNDFCGHLSRSIMDYVLLPILPLFMAGFIIKMVADGTLGVIIKQCGVFGLVLILTYSIYLFVGYVVAHGGNVQKATRAIKNILPAGWIGFSTMSSMAALPLNLKGCEENTHHKDVVGGVLPISTNVHLIGDGIGIPMMALLLMANYSGMLPGPVTYAYFAMMLVLAKFSVAAVPGGGIIVLLPVLHSVFGFSPEMTALITMMYILLDPIITATNVMGNGLFVIVMDKLWGIKMRRAKPLQVCS